MVLVVPRGQQVPEKLLAAATACGPPPGDLNSVQQATQRALVVAGFDKTH